MKKLTKIKLINWHLFSNETIIIKENSLISGENGSGKSTLLDAVQYLLVGGRGSAKFNIAATEEAKRTLEGYVRGRIGAVNKEFIRNGDVITHVALEFFDERNKEYAIVGAILDLPLNSSLKERLYILEGVELTDDIYLDGQVPRNYKEMKEYLSTKDIVLDPFNSQKDYRKALSRYFGMDAKKYSKLLPKALSFKSVDLQQFVFEFLLDDDPVDIKSLKNNISQLKKVEAQIKLEREKLEKLNIIVDQGVLLRQNLNQIKINSIINNLNFVEEQEEKIKKLQERINISNANIERYKIEKSRVDSALNATDNAILDLEKSKDSSNLARTVEAAKTKFDNKNNQYNNEVSTLQQLTNDLENEKNLLKELNEKIPDFYFEQFIKYYSDNKDNYNIDTLTNHLSGVSEVISKHQKRIYSEQQNLENIKNELSEQISISKTRLQDLRRNVKTYPPYVTNLMNSINQELSYKYGKEINARPLADLIEVNDERWRNSVEGYLAQKFNIIVEPAYFLDALEVYDRVKFEQKIYGIGLVNTEKLDASYDDIKEVSLASKIDSDFKYARRYVNMLLNGVTTVEDVKDLKNFKRSITPTGMTYGNYTASQLNPRFYQIPYIGENATKQQINIQEEDLLILEQQLKEVVTKISNHGNALDLLDNSHASRILNQNKLYLYDQVKATKKELLDAEEHYNSISQNPEAKDIAEKIENQRNTRLQLRQEAETFASKIASNRDQISMCSQDIDIIKEKLNNHKNERTDLELETPELLKQAQIQYNSLLEKHEQNYIAVSNEVEKTTNQILTQNIRHETELNSKMKAYCLEYSFGAEPIYENLIIFERERNAIKDQNLIRYEQQATDLRIASEKSFNEDFVNQLRLSIDNAKQQIEELNYALVGKKFGTDQYKLTYAPSEDPEFKTYYEIIMSGANEMEEQGLFTDTLTGRKEQIMTELFEKISSDDPEYDKLAYEFLDYRNYMSYDIEITNQSGNVSFFSQVSREKSGGETQVPFYIVIAASFQQLLSRNKQVDSGCVVLFDEAFNNMDESRIEAMMKFYNSLSIQLLISVPPQRVPNIISYITTSLIIIKHNDYAVVQTFEDEREIK